MTRILSFGGGVQTTAMLLMFPKRYDYVVFADVSKGTKFDEKAQTYWFIENKIKPLCKELGIPFITVTAKLPLFVHCIVEKIIPNTRFRWCTKRFKIYPIRKFVRKELKATAKNPVFQDLGFSFDEFERAGHQDEVKYLKSQYPLVDQKITRDDCKKIIMDEWGFLPPKSGCVYCPFAPKKEFKKIAYEEKLKVPTIIFMEHNNRRYKDSKGIIRNTLKVRYDKRGKMEGIPIEKLLGPDNDTLDGYFFQEDQCESGHCFR